MKKLSLALVAALSLSTAAFAQTAGTAGSDGQIKFTGTITEKGCTIIAGNSATVNLGSMPKAHLMKQKYGAWGTGQVRFVDCNLEIDGKKPEKPLQTVSITIQKGAKSTVTTAPDLWANDGTAENVGIQVEIDGQQVTPNGQTEPLEAKIDSVNGTATYNVRGRMVGAETGVTAGSVETTVSFVASYK